MLEFNPQKRISAEEAIRDKYFDDVRIAQQEENDACDIDLHFDDVELSNEEIRELIINELKNNKIDI